MRLHFHLPWKLQFLCSWKHHCGSWCWLWKSEPLTTQLTRSKQLPNNSLWSPSTARHFIIWRLSEPLVFHEMVFVNWKRNPLVERVFFFYCSFKKLTSANLPLEKLNKHTTLPSQKAHTSHNLKTIKITSTLVNVLKAQQLRTYLRHEPKVLELSPLGLV